MAENTVNASLTVESDLLAEIDARAKALDLNRSQYFRRLAREDLARNLRPPPESQKRNGKATNGKAVAA